MASTTQPARSCEAIPLFEQLGALVGERAGEAIQFGRPRQVLDRVARGAGVAGQAGSIRVPGGAPSRRHLLGMGEAIVALSETDF